MLRSTERRIADCCGKWSVCLSACLSVRLRYRDHIGWKSSKIISHWVRLWCLLAADSNITVLLQREYPQNVDQKWPPPCLTERRRHSMANCGRMVRDHNGYLQWGAYRKTPSRFPMVRSMTAYDLPFAQNGVLNAPLVICWISNGHISATSHPIRFMFRSMVGLGFWDRRIEWRYFRFDKIIMAADRHFGKSRGFPATARLSCCLSNDYRPIS